jgi:hypothetical protein
MKKAWNCDICMREYGAIEDLEDCGNLFNTPCPHDDFIEALMDSFRTELEAAHD